VVDINENQGRPVRTDVEYRHTADDEAWPESVRFIFAVGIVLAIVTITLTFLSYLSSGGF
jgi:hypothetical protein